MKKIVHIITSLEQGGAQTVLNDIIKHMPEQSHYVFFFKKGDFEQRLTQYAALEQIPYAMHNPMSWWFLYKKIKTLAPDILHTILWSAHFIISFINRLLYIPHIASFHNRLLLNGNVRTALDQMFKTRAHVCIAVSHEIKKDLIKKHRWQKPESIIVIPNGVIMPSVCELKQQKTFTIGAVGRFESVKQFSLLLHVVKKLSETDPNIHLLLIGYGTQEKTLRTLASNLHITNQVTFKLKDDAKKWYPFMNCFVQPSQTEGISLALLEAMSYGLPCIASSSDKTHPVILHKVDGLLCIPQIHEIAQAIEQIKNDQLLAFKVARAARDKVKQKFSNTDMIRRYKNCFLNIDKNAFF